MRRSIAALCLVAVALIPACSRNKPPNSLFDGAGYHVRGDKVYYLTALPGKASEIAGADAASFKSFDTTYAKDKSNAYFDGHPILGADATSFDVLDRSGFAKDRDHVYQLDRPISDDPAHFAIVSNNDHYLFTKDSRTVHVNGKPIADADPSTFRVLQGAYAQDARHVYYFSDPVLNADAASFRPLDGPYASDVHRVYWMGKAIDGADLATFRVLNAAFECSADARRAYYRQTVIADADPRTFPPGRAVTGCTETSLSFAE